LRAFAEGRKKLIEYLTNKGIQDEKILEAFLKIPRHLFVPDIFKFESYKDTSLPIGKGQTISQPFTVAYMTQELSLKNDDKVLEIGTGSGFQTAILAFLVKVVYTVEYFPEFTKKAQTIHKSLGLKNIYYKTGDGKKGWKEHAPFDKILCTAALDNQPDDLISQLNDNGILIYPIIDENNSQKFCKIVKNNNIITKKYLNECNFVLMK